MAKIKLLIVLSLFSITSKGLNIDSTYREEPVTLHTLKGDIKGTITIPLIHKKQMPVALLIAGSGPTDRDGNNPYAMNAGLKKLAYALAEKNIASLRYDKRAIGASKHLNEKESDLRFSDYISDAEDWIALLRKDKRFSTITVIGHSEGSLIGISAAAKADKFVSIAGLAQSADITLKKQLASQPQEMKDIMYSMIDSLKRGDTLTNVPPQLYVLFRPGIQQYMISWFAHDPQQEIKKLSIPILIIQGTKDIQVSEEDARLLKKAQPKAELVVIPGMNHIFRIVQGDKDENIKTYNDASLPISKVMTEAIISFIHK